MTDLKNNNFHLEIRIVKWSSNYDFLVYLNSIKF